MPQINPLQQAQFPVYEYLCDDNIPSLNIPIDVQMGLREVCRNGRLFLTDTSPSIYMKGHLESRSISVFVKASPCVVKETIKVNAHVLASTVNHGQIFDITLNGSGDGFWHGTFQGPTDVDCNGRIEIVFQASWKAKPKRFDMYFSRSTELHVIKEMCGDGTLFNLPIANYLHESATFVFQAYGDHYEDVAMRLYNCYSEMIIIKDHMIYCQGNDGSWKLGQDTDSWKILDSQKLVNLIELQPGEFCDLGLACNDCYGATALLVIKTNWGDLFRKISSSEPPVG